MNHRNDWNQDQTLRYQDIPIGELQQKPVSYPFTRFKFQHRLFSSRILQPVDYLLLVEPYIAKELISRKNYAEIKQLADQFTGGITSFFGFETRLNSLDARSDYLFAVSSKKGEREALANLLQNGGLSQRFLQKSEWQHVKDFVLSWADPKSILYDNVLGLWFEFDTAKSFSETPIPSIFVQTSLSCIKDYHDYQKYSWITQIALPILTGSPVSTKIEQRFIQALQELPEGATVIHVASMLSRTDSGMRMVIYKIQPNQIIPYLNSLGWTDENNELSTLIKEIEQYSSRIVLHINIGEEGIDQKIGLECSFHPDLYQFEAKWIDFLDYLIKKEACLPEKKDMLLNFSGVEQEDTSQEFNLKTYKAAVKIADNDFSRALVRFLSHIKISYQPHHKLEAKIYPGVKLFGQIQTTMNGQYQ